jgi:hypothetical protein
MQQIFKSKTPLLHKVIPLFNVITHALDKHIANGILPFAARMAAALESTMLDKY